MVLQTLFVSPVIIMSRGSVVGIATAYGLDDREVRIQVPVRAKILTSLYPPDRLWGSTQPPNHWLPEAISPIV
jgi:hypothetical protein